jgi:hypothetical protein
MKRNIYIPKYILQGIKKNHRSIARDVQIFGGDTETVNGEPHTLQLCHKGATDLYYVNRQTILPTFLEHIDNVLQRGEWALAYFHFLPFDLPVLFRDELAELWQLSSYKVRREGWNCFVNCEKRFFAKLCKDKHKIIYIIDSFAFLPTSLDKIGKMLAPDLPKLKKPAGLGDLPLHTPEFEAYAKRDAVIEEKFGAWIYGIHKQFDIRISVSLPQMASYIFRHKFLKEKDVIQFPPPEVVRAAMLSYHGGKGNPTTKAGVYENCSEIDINSAYPFAMKELPSFLEGEYVYTKKFLPDLCGIYNISGEVHCPYTIFYNDDFKPVDGKFSDIWVTGYELSAALEYKEARIDSLYGYVWLPKSTRNPMADYVDYFYDLKNKTPKKEPMYDFYKKAMNTLYGKFVQCIEIREKGNPKKSNDGDFDFKVTEDAKGNLKVEETIKRFNAGGLFNPFIASMITGRVRAMIHTLEHKFQAIHTATDSIKTLLPITGESDVLGGYKLEIKGLCVLLRNKVYCHFDEDGLLKKYATHGFQGNVENLLDLIVSRKNAYKVEHIFKVREALRQHKEPLKMLSLDKTFHFDWSQFDDRGFSYHKKEIKDKDGSLQKTLYYGKISKEEKQCNRNIR